MGKFFIQRILWILPTIFITLLIVFGLTKLVPGDPVAHYLNRSLEDPELSLFTSQEYKLATSRLGLDKPLFYFSIQPSNYPKDLFTISHRQKFLAKHWLDYYRADWNDIKSFFLRADKIIESEDSSSKIVRNSLGRFIYTPKGKNSIPEFLINPAPFEEPADTMFQHLNELKQLYHRIIKERNGKVFVRPKFYWYGSANQFHQWVSNTLSFDFGYSLRDGQSASLKVFEALRWTLVINIISIAIAYFFAIIIGTYAGYYENSWFDKLTSYLLSFAYAIPIFWMATLFVVFFTTPEFGAWTNIFPSVGIWFRTQEDTFLEILLKNFNQFWIPVICLSTSLMAFIARQVHAGVSQEKSKKYVLQARAKGISEHRILWGHIFRNASFPLITMIAGILPASISGSLVLEVICSIPGMGRLMYQSMLGQDWPIVVAVVFIGIILTIAGLFLSDILYQIVNPKVNLAGK